jgi:hypothetical protein
MGRSDAFRQLRRAIRLALHPDHAGVPAGEAVARVVESQRPHLNRPSRRQFVGGVAAGMATAGLAQFGFGTPRAWAVPLLRG